MLFSVLNSSNGQEIVKEDSINVSIRTSLGIGVATRTDYYPSFETVEVMGNESVVANDTKFYRKGIIVPIDFNLVFDKKKVMYGISGNLNIISLKSYSGKFNELQGIYFDKELNYMLYLYAFGGYQFMSNKSQSYSFSLIGYIGSFLDGAYTNIKNPISVSIGFNNNFNSVIKNMLIYITPRFTYNSFTYKPEGHIYPFDYSAKQTQINLTIEFGIHEKF